MRLKKVVPYSRFISYSLLLYNSIKVTNFDLFIAILHIIVFILIEFQIYDVSNKIVKFIKKYNKSTN